MKKYLSLVLAFIFFTASAQQPVSIFVKPNGNALNNKSVGASISVPVAAPTVVISAEVQAFTARIQQNAGNIQYSDVIAANNFVGAAKLHGYWSKLIAVATLSGDNIGAVQTMLKYPNGLNGILTNQGFTNSDYSPTEGITVSNGKYFNTKINLSGNTTGGTYGLSMYLTADAQTTFGLPNSGMPYTLLQSTANQVFMYSDQTSAGQKLNTTDDFLLHFEKSNSASRLFVDSTLLSTQPPASFDVRNGELQLFRYESVQGKCKFFAVDNGLLTNTELSYFRQDVYSLLYDEGRKMLAPIIAGAYVGIGNSNSPPRTIIISQPPTASVLNGAEVHYTLDGSSPTLTSPKYQAPISIKTLNSVPIRAASFKNNRSAQTNPTAWSAVVDSNFYISGQYYATHLMGAPLEAYGSGVIIGYTNTGIPIEDTAYRARQFDTLVMHLIARGQNLAWYHIDGYSIAQNGDGTPNYNADPDGAYKALHMFMGAVERAQAKGYDFHVLWGWSPINYWKVANIMFDTWDSPSTLKINGRRIYGGYYYFQGLDFFEYLIKGVLAQGRIYSKSFGPAHAPVDTNAYAVWPFAYLPSDNYTATSNQIQDVKYLNSYLQDNNTLFGLLYFSVDTKNDLNSRISYNPTASKNLKEKGMNFMAGATGIYNLAQTEYTGYEGLKAMWEAILALPVVQRPIAFNETTNNDYVENSYTENTIAPGGFKPGLDSLGLDQWTSEIRQLDHPYADPHRRGSYFYPTHEGIPDFCKPWRDAWRNKQASPVFTDNIFGWYWLHPLNVPGIPTVPAALTAAYPKLNQAWWDSTAYKSGQNDPAGLTGEIKTYFAEYINRIEVACHSAGGPYKLTVNINGTDYDSPVMTDQVGYWRVPQQLGKIILKMKRPNQSGLYETVIQGPGPDIRNSIFPSDYKNVAFKVQAYQ